jgi:hypothetical protein
MFDKTVIEARLKFCQVCEKRTTVLRMQKCSACGCLISVKVLFDSSECPLKKW